MPTPSKPNSNDSTPPSSPSNSGVSSSSTESQAPLAEREPLPDWLLNQHERMAGSPDPSPDPDPTGSSTPSEPSPNPSPPSENVWKPWNGEMTVPQELVPLFLRTTAMTAMQIVNEDLEQLTEMLARVPEEEVMLEYTLMLKQATLNLTRVVLYGIVLQNEDAPSPILTPEQGLIGHDGRPLRRTPDA